VRDCCRFSQIHAGANFGMVVTTEGHAYTWGNGELGQLGHQENKNKKVPKKISALRELEVPVNLGMRPVVPLRDELEAAG
jgi:alpha-tubulin suppressor-like RCC1 family protein